MVLKKQKLGITILKIEDPEIIDVNIEKNKLCFTFEYKDEKSYKQCQKFIEEWQRATDNSSVPRKVFSNRGIIIADYKSE